MSLELHGIVVPVVTPLQEDESLDAGALKIQLDRLMDAGIHGLFFLGSTGEEPALRDDVKSDAIRVAVNHVSGRIPVVVGTMASSTARTVDNIRRATDLGADAVAVTPPHYFPSAGESEQFAHYQACAAASTIPLVVYNIPSTTKVHLSPGVTQRIAELPGVIGIKDSSGDFQHFLRLLSAFRSRPEFQCLVGSPMLGGAALIYGAQGIVPGIANVDPWTLVDLYQMVKSGGADRLWELQCRVQMLIGISAHGPNISCLKTALELLGVCSHRACAPLQPVSPEGRERIRAALLQLGLLPPG